MAKQLSESFETKFSKTSMWISEMPFYTACLDKSWHKSWQHSLDKGNLVGTVLMDLSKAYDCLPRDLLIAKLPAYGVDMSSLNLIHDYLSNRFHCVRIGAYQSEWLNINSGISRLYYLFYLLIYFKRFF